LTLAALRLCRTRPAGRGLPPTHAHGTHKAGQIRTERTGGREENDKIVRIDSRCPTCRSPNQSRVGDDRFRRNLDACCLWDLAGHIVVSLSCRRRVVALVILSTSPPGTRNRTTKLGSRRLAHGRLSPQGPIPHREFHPAGLTGIRLLRPLILLPAVTCQASRACGPPVR
jgi:hypothetical protein